MSRRTKLALGLVSVFALFAQGALAGICASACSQPVSSSAKPSCHSQKASPTKQGCSKNCSGACNNICAPDKAFPVTSSAIENLALQLDVPFAVLAPKLSVPIARAERPELFQTDSSPPTRPHGDTSGLRAPPSLGA